MSCETATMTQTLVGIMINAKEQVGEGLDEVAKKWERWNLHSTRWWDITRVCASCALTVEVV